MPLEPTDKLMEELQSRNCSKVTIATYVTRARIFIHWLDKPLHHAGIEDIRQFRLFLLKNEKEPKTINTYLAAVKFYYREILRRRIRIAGVRQKKKLPVVHTRETIDRMIASLNNPRHKLLLMLLYGSGLIVSEAVAAQSQDIDTERGILLVRQGKGRKDRLVCLSQRFVSYYTVLNPEKGYLFPGRHGHLCARSAEEIVAKAAKKVLGRPTFPHSLRASFVTHLLERGEGITHIQALLGHEHLETTEVMRHSASRTGDRRILENSVISLPKGEEVLQMGLFKNKAWQA
ncbi:TPA: tyrosine-type recombinase/integrase [Candidatus Woesearchaeota archaeon]|nr:tyrosine-type recombinase/integrase [Candidatus Woesearchaeota archaeon]HII69265.1 tyrosine-type recombinase/integrase [Candidatus Woesearchaeota archaeon]